MANGDSKTPTWQHISGIIMSLLLLVTSVLLYETRADIKENRQGIAGLSERVKSIEDTMPLQFEAIKEWREEIRRSLEQIANNQRFNATRQMTNQDILIKGQKSAAQVKEWNKIK